MSALSYGLIISKLSVKNFATFDDQTINFVNGFNAIIGETGSGKSLVLDALQLILGGRADKKLIRKGHEFAVVESSFECSDSYIQKYFYELGYPFDEEITVKRVLYSSGKTKSFLNHQSCSLATLSDFAKRFIDLVGQFENQKLLASAYQLKLLDNFGLNQVLQQEYQSLYDKLIQKREALLLLKKSAKELAQKKDYLDFQISEFSKLEPSVEREEELLDKKRILQNLEENKSVIAEFNTLFDGDESNLGISTMLGRLENLLSSKLISEEDLNSFYNAKECITNLNYKINNSLDVDFDEQDFEDVIDELDQYSKLKRKYSVETKELSELYAKLIKEREELENIDQQIVDLKSHISKIEKQATKLAIELHERRCDQAKSLSKLLTKEVRKLRMIEATIKIELSKQQELNSTGMSQIHFQAETNPGEGYYHIKDIASGGELSRILLALRTVLSSKDSINIFLFDEIDSGIGGETATCVGKALNKVSLNSQVIAITHLAQIAKFADKLLYTYKSIKLFNDEKRTVSQIKEINDAKNSAELSQMAGL